MTRDANIQANRNELDLAKRISESGRDWERREIEAAEKAAERLLAARRLRQGVTAENPPVQPAAPEGQ